jgi:hypothetical protein
MTNEQIVMERWNNNRFLGKTSVEFRVTRDVYFYEEQFNRVKLELDTRIESLKKIENIVDRVNEILIISRSYPTYFTGTNRYQCKAGARMSTIDIWRIYKNYFEEVDIFTIMRALFVLVETTNLNTFRCCTVRKRVFWFENWAEKNYDVRAELGVPLIEWKDIGLNQNEQASAE